MQISFEPGLSRAIADGGKKPSPHGTGKAGNPLSKAAASTGRRILIIDDDPYTRELYEFLLETSGHEVLLTADGRTGLALALSARPDLIICDIRLPQIGGGEVMRQLKRDPSLRHIPIIASTILSSAGHRERLLDAGFDGYIPKPIEAKTFAKQIENFLELAKD